MLLSQKASEKESVLPEALRLFLYALIIRCKNYFVFFIFVVKAAHENILTTKISRSTVYSFQFVSIFTKKDSLLIQMKINGLKYRGKVLNARVYTLDAIFYRAKHKTQNLLHMVIHAHQVWKFESL